MKSNKTRKISPKILKRFAVMAMSLLLVLSCLSVPAFAADKRSTVVKGREINSTVERVFAEYAGKPHAKVVVDNRLLGKLRNGSSSDIKAEKLAGELSKYVLVEAKAVSAGIANNYGSYTVVILDSGVETVYIAVNIAEHPELYRLDCFHAAVTELVEGQKPLVSSGNTALMDYNHVAGELALHMIIYGVTAPIVHMQGDRTPSVIQGLYNQSKVADLNIDENRVPSSLINIVGVFSEVFYQVIFGGVR